MNIEMRYFIYHFKKTLIRLAILSMAAITMTLSVVYSYESWNSGKVYSLSFGGMMFLLAAMGVILPLLEIGDFKNKRNLDSWFSFPIERWKILLIHILNGAIHIAIAFSIAVIVALIQINGAPAEAGFDPSYMPAFWASSLFYGLLVYLFCFFPAVIASNMVDAVILIAMYNILPYRIAYFLALLTNSSKIGLDLFGPVPCLVQIMGNFNKLVENKQSQSMIGIVLSAFEEDVSFLMIVVSGILCLAAGAGAVFFFDRVKAEDLGGISDSRFAYKVCIPLINALAILSGEGNVITGLFRGIAIFITYVVYRRGFKLRKSDVIIISVLTVVAMIPINYGEYLSNLFG